MNGIHQENVGVSVVICCYNSASRLPQTLAHLAAQQATVGLMNPVPWEVIVVDNASTDQTALLALNLWPADAPAPLRVVQEPQLGLIHARIRGFCEARFELVSFIDDDNWPCPCWVATISGLMRQHPTVGACGGSLTAVSERSLPTWFARYADSYAVGQQALGSGDVTTTRGYLWGAGLTIRKSAWEELHAAGFSPLLPGRSGALLSAGEDHEICLALRLAGWRLWYDERLQLQHYLPPQRLEWNYLRRLHRGFGASFVVLSIYLNTLEPPLCLLRHFRQTWFFETVGCFCLFVIQSAKWYLSPTTSLAAEQALLQCEYYQGKLCALWQQRRMYPQMVQRIHTLAERLKAQSTVTAPLGKNDSVFNRISEGRQRTTS